jgi:hypothetical protein
VLGDAESVVERVLARNAARLRLADAPTMPLMRSSSSLPRTALSIHFGLGP